MGLSLRAWSHPVPRFGTVLLAKTDKSPQFIIIPRTRLWVKSPDLDRLRSPENHGDCAH